MVYIPVILKINMENILLFIGYSPYINTYILINKTDHYLISTDSIAFNTNSAVNPI